MLLRRVTRLTNTRVRLAVGLLLAAMFCIQCTRSEAFRSSMSVTAISGQSVGRISPQQLKELERLAREDHVALLKQALKNYRNNYQDYTCTFVKQERINGRLRPQETMQVKFMEKPFSVAMEWKENPSRADRVLYVKGKYNGQMLIVPHSVWARMATGGLTRRDPESKDVLANTRRPVTMFGFRRSIESLLKVYELAAARGEGKFSFEGYRSKAHKVMVLKRVLPPRKDYPAKTTIWYLDVDHLVPISLEAKDWNDLELCYYSYSNVRFNVGLTENDFTPKANGMKLK